MDWGHAVEISITSEEIERRLADHLARFLRSAGEQPFVAVKTLLTTDGLVRRITFEGAEYAVKFRESWESAAFSLL
jgi:hypothetical protein